jgi:hypothetical protein
MFQLANISAIAGVLAAAFFVGSISHIFQRELLIVPTLKRYLIVQ